MSKTITWIVIAIIVLGALWYFVAPHTTLMGPSPEMPMQNGQADQSAQQVSASGTSNAQLQADLSTIDSQVQAAGTANTSASSFNDTPVQQTE